MNVDAMLETLLMGRIIEVEGEEGVLVGDKLVDILFGADLKMATLISALEQFERETLVSPETLLRRILESQGPNQGPTIYPNLDRLLKRAKPATDSEESLL